MSISVSGSLSMQSSRTMAISRGSSLRIQGLQQLYGLGDEAWTSSGQGHVLVSTHISFELQRKTCLGVRSLGFWATRFHEACRSSGLWLWAPG